MALPGDRDEPFQNRRRPGRIRIGVPGEFQCPEIHPIPSVYGPGRSDHAMERRLAAPRRGSVFEVIDDERPGMQHLDGVDNQGRRVAATAGERICLLQDGGPEPFSADAGIQVGGELKRFGPAVPSPSRVVKGIAKTERVCDHVSPGPSFGKNDLTKRIGARPLGGLPMTIWAASVIVKRWA